MTVLDVGCGGAKTPGSVGIDIEPHPGVDIVHDLNQFPYPFGPDEFDRIVARHCLEHLENVVKVMDEFHRVVKARGLVEIEVPHFSSCDAYTDVTHKHFFSYHSFDYFTEAGLYGVHRYGKGRYEIAWRHFDFWPLSGESSIIPHRLLGIEWFANHYPTFYEKFLAFIFPAKSLSVRLVVVKL